MSELRSIVCPLCQEKINVIPNIEKMHENLGAHAKDKHRNLNLKETDELELYLLCRFMAIRRLMK